MKRQARLGPILAGGSAGRRGWRLAAALVAVVALPAAVAVQAGPAQASVSRPRPAAASSYGPQGAPPISVGSNPRGVAVDPTTGTVFVTNFIDGTVSVISEATGQVDTTVGVGGGPIGVAVDPTTGTVFVANYGYDNRPDTVSVISEAADPANDAVTATLTTAGSPLSVAADPVHGTVWVAECGGPQLQEITEAANPANDTIGAPVTLPGGCPAGTDSQTVAVDPTTSTVYATDGNNAVAVISEAAGTVTGTIPVGNTPQAVAADPTTGTVYVANEYDGTVSVISEAAGTVTGTIQLPAAAGNSPAPSAMAIDQNTGTVYVTSDNIPYLWAISEATSTLTTTINDVGGPAANVQSNGMAFDPATGDAYLSSTSTNQVYVMLSQAISFTAPSCAAPGCQIGQTATLTATGGTSGNPVVFTVDPASGAGVCSVSGTNGTTLSYTASGNCMIDANQAPSGYYLPAPQVTASVTVLPSKPQKIHWASPGTGYYGATVTLKATATSGLPVVFTVDPTTNSGICSVSGTNGTTLSYTGVGSCVIDANQAGNGIYLSATQMQATIVVIPAIQTITFKPPATGVVGKSATLTATGGASGNPVVLGLDPSANPAVCNLSSTNPSNPSTVTVTYTAPGSCVIDATQLGSNDYQFAEVTASITVGIAPTFVQASPPLSAVPGSAYSYTFVASGVGAPTYSLAAGAPSWLGINPTTGQVSGTVPGSSGSSPAYTYSVTATNTHGTATTSRFVVLPAPAAAPATAQVSNSISCGSTLSTCTVTITNSGPATQVVASVVLPAQLYLTGGQCPDSWSCFPEANTLTWSLGSMAAGSSASFPLNLAVAGTCPPNPGCPPLEVTANTPSLDNLDSGYSSYGAANQLVPSGLRRLPYQLRRVT